MAIPKRKNNIQIYNKPELFERRKEMLGEIMNINLGRA